MHLIGFVIRIYHDARSPESQTNLELSIQWPLSSSQLRLMVNVA